MSRQFNIPEKLFPIFSSLVLMDSNIRHVIKRCNPTVKELEMVVKLYLDYGDWGDEKSLGIRE